MQAARPGLRVLVSASRRPARPQRPRHASRVTADPPFRIRFTVVRFCVCVWFAGTIADRERAERTYVVYGLRVRLSVDEGT